MSTPTTTFAPLTHMCASFDRFVSPQSAPCSVILLVVRAYPSYVFSRSGPAKLNDWDMTVLLFTGEYKASLLPPALAAAFGTFGELAFPSLILAGIVPWLVAAGLFFVNVVTAVSYWADLSVPAIEFHFVWGVLITLVAAVGLGWLAVQTP